jgi:hypothetical protein
LVTVRVFSYLLQGWEVNQHRTGKLLWGTERAPSVPMQCYYQVLDRYHQVYNNLVWLWLDWHPNIFPLTNIFSLTLYIRHRLSTHQNDTNEERNNLRERKYSLCTLSTLVCHPKWRSNLQDICLSEPSSNVTFDTTVKTVFNAFGASSGQTFICLGVPTFPAWRRHR